MLTDTHMGKKLFGDGDVLDEAEFGVERDGDVWYHVTLDPLAVLHARSIFSGSLTAALWKFRQLFPDNEDSDFPKWLYAHKSLALSIGEDDDYGAALSALYDDIMEPAKAWAVNADHAHMILIDERLDMLDAARRKLSKELVDAALVSPHDAHPANGSSFVVAKNLQYLLSILNDPYQTFTVNGNSGKFEHPLEVRRVVGWIYDELRQGFLSRHTAPFLSEHDLHVLGFALKICYSQAAYRLNRTRKLLNSLPWLTEFDDDQEVLVKDTWLGGYSQVEGISWSRGGPFNFIGWAEGYGRGIDVDTTCAFGEDIEIQFEAAERVVRVPAVLRVYPGDVDASDDLFLWLRHPHVGGDLRCQCGTDFYFDDFFHAYEDGCCSGSWDRFEKLNRDEYQYGDEIEEGVIMYDWHENRVWCPHCHKEMDFGCHVDIDFH